MQKIFTHLKIKALMKKALSLFAPFALGLSMTLALGSCKDNDLAEGGQNGGDGTEQNEALAQKYQALQTLLGSLASVDTLPSNWNSDTYTVTPTVGDVNNDAEPHVRYVVTTSQAEADRIYRSYLSKDVTGTPTNDTWQMDGIGSMQFNLENTTDHFATLRVNVKQLPTLEEIRFVSEDALGSNGLISPSGTYYSFGDVVYQDLTGKDEKGQVVHTPTFWVCVRPCSMKPKRRQSHWCTFQLVPYGDENLQNYLKVGDNNYLPTRLAFNKSDAERMVQNFFNVLRLMADPQYALQENYEGIDVISSTNNINKAATWKELSNTSFLWNYFNMWDPNLELSDGTGGVINNEYANPDDDDDDDDFDNDIKNVLTDYKESSIDAFYNGYSTNYFSKGDYTVYNLHLTADYEDALFSNVKKQTAYVNKSEGFDFTKFVTGKKNAEPNVHFSSNDKHSKYQFIVKYRTGAEIEANGAGHSAIDINPAESFDKRKANNQITDVLVTRKYLNRKAYTKLDEKGQEQGDLNVLPFFCFGDEVGIANYSDRGELFCIRNAYPNYDKLDEDHDLTDWKTQASFISTQRINNINGVAPIEPTDDEVVAAYISILPSMLEYNSEISKYMDYAPTEITYKTPKVKTQHLDALQRLYTYYLEHGTLWKLSTQNLPINGVTQECKLFKLQLKTSENCYYLFYYIKAPNGSSRVEIKKSNTPFLQQEDEQSTFYFYRYNDAFAYNENFSVSNRWLRVIKKDERKALKAYRCENVKNFIQKFKVQVVEE